MNSLQKGQDERERGDVRKTYITPQVQIYGDLRQITQGNIGMCHDDGIPCNGGSQNMTH